MNEFTKQELEQLSFAIYTYPHSDDDHIYDELRSKIKAMIDSYCEHEGHGKTYCPGLYDKVCVIKCVSRCVKCHRYFE